MLGQTCTGEFQEVETLDNKGDVPREPLDDFINKTQRLVNEDGPSYETKDQPLWRLIHNAAEQDYFSTPKVCRFWFYNKNKLIMSR